MKLFLYITAIALVAYSCSSTRNLSNTVEDDIYYVPGKKALVVQEVEKLTGQDLGNLSTGNDRDLSGEISSSQGSSIAPAAFSKGSSKVINTQTGRVDNLNMNDLTGQAQNMLANNEEVNEILYENTGYWIGGYKGNEGDLNEIQRIINMYPDGFAYFNGNGQDIAMNLAFDSDWNVYTDNGRYWWFPSYTNIDLYSSLLFGTYPKYIWTVVWDNPRFDSWAFNSSFNSGLSLGLSVGSGGWGFGFGWNSGWYDPWYRPWNNPWYNGWYDPWYRPWYGYYPHWHHPHWNHPHWNHPNWGNGGSSNRPSHPLAGQRPNSGGGVSGIRPGTNRPGSSNRPSTSARPSTSQRPQTGDMTRPGNTTNNRQPSVRPNTSGIIRPGTSGRPGTTTRPNNSGYTRPSTGSSTRPSTQPSTRPGSSTTTRPSYTRPNSSPTTRPSTPRQSTSRPATRPTSNTRPTNNSNNSYSRPQNNYRPTYNTNSSVRNNSGGSSRSESNYSAPPRSSNNGGGSRPGNTTARPGRR